MDRLSGSSATKLIAHASNACIVLLANAPGGNGSHEIRAPPVRARVMCSARMIAARETAPMQSFNAMHAYHALLRQYGPQGWWPIYRRKKLKVKSDAQYQPEESATRDLTRCSCPQRLSEEIRFQICVGAILTQNTAWTNVERALAGLASDSPALHSVERGSRRGRGTPWEAAHIAEMSRVHLARLIRPAGYFNQKAKNLHIFSRWLLREHDGSLAQFFRLPSHVCRLQLLSLWGIGPETADSMLLYAGRHPVFVIDTYTKRFLAQHDITFRTYDEYQQFFMERLPPDATLFNEYHALIVRWGKERHV